MRVRAHMHRQPEAVLYFSRFFHAYYAHQQQIQQSKITFSVESGNRVNNAASALKRREVGIVLGIVPGIVSVFRSTGADSQTNTFTSSPNIMNARACVCFVKTLVKSPSLRTALAPPYPPCARDVVLSARMMCGGRPHKKQNGHFRQYISAVVGAAGAGYAQYTKRQTSCAKKDHGGSHVHLPHVLLFYCPFCPRTLARQKNQPIKNIIGSFASPAHSIPPLIGVRNRGCPKVPIRTTYIFILHTSYLPARIFL